MGCIQPPGDVGRSSDIREALRVLLLRLRVERWHLGGLIRIIPGCLHGDVFVTSSIERPQGKSRTR